MTKFGVPRDRLGLLATGRTLHDEYVLANLLEGEEIEVRVREWTIIADTLRWGSMPLALSRGETIYGAVNLLAGYFGVAPSQIRLAVPSGVLSGTELPADGIPARVTCSVLSMRKSDDEKEILVSHSQTAFVFRFHGGTTMSEVKSVLAEILQVRVPFSIVTDGTEIDLSATLLSLPAENFAIELASSMAPPEPEMGVLERFESVAVFLADSGITNRSESASKWVKDLGGYEKVRRIANSVDLYRNGDEEIAVKSFDRSASHEEMWTREADSLRLLNHHCILSLRFICLPCRDDGAKIATEFQPGVR
jgi:hypothetical protein